MGNTTKISRLSLFFLHVNSERHVQIYNDLVIGRTEGNERFPNDTSVSSRHFRIDVKGEDVFIQDLNFKIKTKVNGREIPVGSPIKLNANDVIEFGNQKFVIKSQSKQIYPTASEALKGFFTFSNWEWDNFLLVAAILFFSIQQYTDEALNSPIKGLESVLGFIFIQLISGIIVVLLHFYASYAKRQQGKYGRIRRTFNTIFCMYLFCIIPNFFENNPTKKKYISGEEAQKWIISHCVQKPLEKSDELFCKEITSGSPKKYLSATTVNTWKKAFSELNSEIQKIVIDNVQPTDKPNPRQPTSQ